MIKIFISKLQYIAGGNKMKVARTFKWKKNLENIIGVYLYTTF